MDPTGSIVDGRYRVIELLGRGGMGSVYRAEHVRLGRPVALKLLNPELRQFPEINARFAREAFATGRLEHPNCVGISDCGELADGTLYLVTELIDGVVLADLLGRVGRLEVRRALRITRHVLSGLAHAHAAGVIHRDIKPDNIVLVERDGDPDFVKILDFGIAKLLGTALDAVGGEQLTQAGLSLGTPAYVSPEQALGRPLDARSDIYSVSVMLYEMLAGAPPFTDDDPLAVMSMHTTREIPALSQVAPGARVPAAVEELMRTGLARRAEARVPTATAYIARIDELLEGLEVRAAVPADTSIARGAAAAPFGWRRWWVALGIGAVIGFALGVAVTVSPGASPDTSPALSGASADEPEDEADDAPIELHGVAAEAAALLDAGQAQGAIALLGARAAEADADPTAQLVLGHAQVVANRPSEAAVAYRRAIAAEPAIGRDRVLRENLASWLDARDPNSAGLALPLLAQLAQGGDEHATRQLARAASSHRDGETRQRARELAEAAGAGDRIDRLASLMLDLETGRRCEDRKQAVVALRALGDPRAIPALEASRERLGKGGFLDLETVNYNWCLKRSAEEAIRHLEGRSAAPAND